MIKTELFIKRIMITKKLYKYFQKLMYIMRLRVS